MTGGVTKAVLSKAARRPWTILRARRDSARRLNPFAVARRRMRLVSTSSGPGHSQAGLLHRVQGNAVLPAAGFLSDVAHGPVTHHMPPESRAAIQVAAIEELGLRVEVVQADDFGDGAQRSNGDRFPGLRSKADLRALA